MISSGDEELLKSNRELEIVNRVNQVLLTDSDIESRLTATLSEIMQAIGVNAGVVFIKSHDSREIICRAQCGFDLLPEDENFHISMDALSYSVRTVCIGKTHVMEDLCDKPNDLTNIINRYDIKSALFVPIISSSKAIGVLCLIEREQRRKFTPKEITIVEVLTASIASAVANAILCEGEQKYDEEINKASHMASVGEMLAGAAHSFGNVLMALKGSILLAREAISSGESKKDAIVRLDRAMQQIQCGTDVVYRILNLSRGVKSGPIRGINPERIVETVLALCRTHPLSKGKTITNLVPPDMSSVMAHEGFLQEVILNLALNALHAVRIGGEVRIEAEVFEADGYVDLRVIDNGCGIDPLDMERIFEPFYSTKGGTGLGLSSSAEMVHRMGGAITVESELDKGTVFTVRLALEGSDWRVDNNRTAA